MLFSSEAEPIHSFWQIVHVPTIAIQEALHHVENDVLRLAVFGATPEARKAICDALSDQAVLLLEEDVAALKNVSREQVEVAQKKFVEVLKALGETVPIVKRKVS